MSAGRRTEFVSVSLTADARQQLRQAAVDATGPAGRQVSMSETLIAALHVASLHPEELAAHLTDGHD